MFKAALRARSVVGVSKPRPVLYLVTMSCVANGQRAAASLSVAVIGAGAAGLVAARELKREGHQVTVFEQADQVGGVWCYTDEVEEEDLLGQVRERRRVHGSLYRSLRTNLPRHVMAFTDFPFDFAAAGTADDRLFCGHEEVLRYLRQFDKAFGISKLVRFNTLVKAAAPLKQGSLQSSNGHPADSEEQSCWPGWQLTSQSLTNGHSVAEVYDAMLVCNGHYSDPRVPTLPGSADFPGKQLHTHNFRDKTSFRGQTVVVMGASASGQDIAREIAQVADKVYFSARPMRFGSKQIAWESSDVPFGPQNNMLRRAAIQSLGADGSVTFSDGWRAENVDVVVYATGYKFTFPFLEHSGVINVQDNRVSPLYQHTVCSSHPTLSFIGLPWQVIPFPLMELQSKWVARILSGRSHLPSREEMERHTQEFHRQREADGIPVRYSHRLGEDQWEYNEWLAKQIGPDQDMLPDWRARMHKVGQMNIRERPEDYRDSWPVPELVAEGEKAAQELRQRAAQEVLVA